MLRYHNLNLPVAFLRAEITGLFELHDGGIMAVAKKGLFKSSPVGGNFKKVLLFFVVRSL